MDGGVGGDNASAAAPLAKWRSDFSKAFQYYLDRSTPHTVERWLGTLAAAIIFVLRVYYVRGFYVVCYGLGIYVLNLLIGFLSPKDDPELDLLDGASLPTKGSDEFRPFVRRLPEFKFCSFSQGKSHFKIHSDALASLSSSLGFVTLIQYDDWDETRSILSFVPYLTLAYSITKAFVVAFVLTFISVLDVPVFWPILLCYWIVLFVLTMKRQILHMIKYKYVPFTIGKQRYTGKKSSASSSTLPRD